MLEAAGINLHNKDHERALFAVVSPRYGEFFFFFSLGLSVDQTSAHLEEAVVGRIVKTEPATSVLMGIVFSCDACKAVGISHIFQIPTYKINNH